MSEHRRPVVIQPRKHSSALDRILGRADTLDQPSLAILVQRLAGERALLETVFNTIQEGILITDTAGLIEYSNAAANRFIGLREQDLGKATLWKLVPGLAHSLAPYFTSDPQAGIVLPALTREIQINYPEPRYLRLCLSRLDNAQPHFSADNAQPRFSPDDDTPLVRYLVILLDITADKITTEDLIESERVNSIITLAAGVAHELGNPLNSINIHLQLIARKIQKMKPPAEVARVTESLAVCAAEIKRLDDIIHNFLGAIRSTPPDLQEVHLLAIIAEVLALLKSQCEDLGIRVNISLRQDLPPVNGDKGQLKQVFFNLIKNAMEAMDNGGTIDIDAAEDDQQVTIRIADTGVGIERDALSRIFDPFFTTKQGGHGLGMMVVMRILRAHGAQISLESLPSQGTTVTVQFPLQNRRIRLLGTDETNPET